MAEQPIEPAALAAASLLAAGEVEAQGGETEGGVWSGQAQLAGLVRQAVTGRNLAAVVDDVAVRPQDPAAVGALARVLAILAAEDRTFAGELGRLVGQAEHEPAIGELATTITGNARVGKLVTIGRAGSVHVHLPPPPPRTILDRLHRAAASGPLVANLPPRNPAFTGRGKLLDQLHASLHPGQAAAVVQVQAQALHGLGGVGKTQLALEYAYRHASDYDLIWWVTAEQPAAIPTHLVALARRLGIPESPEQAETVQVLWDALRSRDRWLLIFDNAEDLRDLRPWWPPSSGRLLVTSRIPTWTGLAAAIPVDVLSRAEAVAFLRRRLNSDDPAFAELAETLGDLPLALEQAAAYLDETATAVNDYLDLLATHARELFQRGRPATTDQTIATTWAASLDRIRTRSAAAEDLLCLCAFLAPDDLPHSLLTDHHDVLPDPLAAAVRDRLGFQQMLGAVRRYSLVTVTGDAVSMHRLVQAVIRDGLAPDEQRSWATVALHLILAGFPEDVDNATDGPTAMRLLAHALTVTSHPAPKVTDPEATVSLLNRVGEYVWGRADYHQAKELYEQATSIAADRLGPDHPITAWSLHNLAHTLDDQGHPDTARTVFERALAVDEAQLGPGHLATAHILHNLSDVLTDLGELDHARTLLQQALVVYEARLDANHPEVAVVLTKLATVLAEQGELARARALHERALRIREARLGSDHPLTAWSLTSLGAVLHQQGDLARARTLHEHALAIYETRLSPDPPYTAKNLTNLGALLHAQGALGAAQTCHERALAIREARLGVDHPLTAWSLDHLAGVLAEQGDPAGARALHERALAIRESRLGPDNLRTAQSLHSLANILRDQGDLDGARPLLERAVAIREARLGADHPDTLRSQRILAAVVATLDKQQ